MVDRRRRTQQRQIEDSEDSEEEEQTRNRNANRSSPGKRRSRKPPTVLDGYGFEVTLTPLQQQELASCAQAAQEHIPKWSFVEQLKPYPGESRLKKLVRAGVPPLYRRQVWMQISGANALRTSKPATYFANMVAAESRSKSVRQIDLDLPRTFPGHEWLQSEEGQVSIRNVLVAFSLHNQRVGYCQGLNCVAAFLLLCTDQAEEDAFWLLVALTDRILYPNTHAPNLDGCHVEMRTLGQLIASKLPRLHHHLEALSCDVSVFSTDWFLCLFCTSLPSESAARVWDALFHEGAKVLFRVALALLQMHEALLLTKDNAGEVLMVIKESAAAMHNADLLMKTAFDKVGSMPMAKIDQIRAQESVEVDKMLKAREAARKKQELKERLAAEQRRRDEEAERRMEEGIPDTTPAEELAQAAAEKLKFGAQQVGRGLNLVAGKAMEAARKVKEAATAGAAGSSSPEGVGVSSSRRRQ
mmetsp:Transcript_8835/g.18886  ORF Transcript_8835/g.18886 Transcript_8835/m.18886 type:complete len:470 (+) Transcript_8835:84-1493(+)